ncbi:hypothetical protein L1049_010847 [Liquidambar formosana]|uniref:Uncharacterized protein n=1 Tax=Liquidambar formosana TaxID=63359 RepID=A0AAP0RRD2_LIQFO
MPPWRDEMLSPNILEWLHRRESSVKKSSHGTKPSPHSLTADCYCSGTTFRTSGSFFVLIEDSNLVLNLKVEGNIHCPLAPLERIVVENPDVELQFHTCIFSQILPP